MLIHPKTAFESDLLPSFSCFVTSNSVGSSSRSLTHKRICCDVDVKSRLHEPTQLERTVQEVPYHLHLITISHPKTCSPKDYVCSCIAVVTCTKVSCIQFSADVRHQKPERTVQECSQDVRLREAMLRYLHARLMSDDVPRYEQILHSMNRLWKTVRTAHRCWSRPAGRDRLKNKGQFRRHA